MNKNRNKSCKTRHLITVLAVLLLLFGCMGCSKKTPRETLEEAFEKTFVTENPTESIFGMSDISAHLSGNKVYSTGYSTGFSVTLQELSGEELSEYSAALSGLGLRIDTATEPLNRKGVGTLDISYGGTKYLSLGGQLEGSKIYLTAPQLLDGSLSVDLSTLKDDLSSDSMFGQMLSMYNIEIPEDLSSQLMESIASPTSLVNLGSLVSSYTDLCNSIQVETADKKSVNFSSGVSYKNAYKVTVPKHAYTTFINSLLQYASDSSSGLTDSSDGSDQGQLDMLNLKLSIQEMADSVGDIIVYVGTSKDNYICCAESNISMGSDSIRFQAALTGKDNPLNDAKVTLSAKAFGQNADFTLSQLFNTETKNLSFDFAAKLNGVTELQLSGVGTFKDVVKGRKFTFDYDHIDVNLKDALTLSLSGDVYIDITKSDIPEAPSEELNIFRMSEDEYTALIDEIYTNLQEDPLLSTLLGAVDLGM